MLLLISLCHQSTLLSSPAPVAACLSACRSDGDADADVDMADADGATATPEKKRIHSSKSRSMSRGRALSLASPNSGSGLKDVTMRNRGLKMADKAQRLRNKMARIGEADRHIGTKMPKHLFSGKRPKGKTDRR